MTETVAAPRLDVWLAERRATSRHQASVLIAGGLVRVNGRPGRPGTRINESDVVEVADPPPAAPVEMRGPSVDLQVVFEDEWLAVIDKPAGLVVHPAPGHASGTLADGLRQRGTTWSLLGGSERPGIVHRLDRDTSGLIVVAKTEAAHRHLAAQLQKRTLGRTYWALVRGGFSEATGTIDKPIARDPGERRRMGVVDGGREAVTDFRVVARYPRSTELDVDLRTGRTHQIRVHLASIGHPVIGDVLYGRTTAPRLALHARRLRLVHPDGSGERVFEAPLPPELEALRRSAAEGQV